MYFGSRQNLWEAKWCLKKPWCFNTKVKRKNTLNYCLLIHFSFKSLTSYENKFNQTTFIMAVFSLTDTTPQPAASVLGFPERSAYFTSSTASFRGGGGTGSRNSHSCITTGTQSCSFLISHSISLLSFKQRGMNIRESVNPLRVLHWPTTLQLLRYFPLLLGQFLAPPR